jgi:hypothetical protein
VDCERTRQMLHDFVDLELPEGDRRLLSEHLESCERCRGFHGSLAALKNLLHAKARRPLPSPELPRTILRALPAGGGLPRSARGPLAWLAAAGGVAAVTLAVFMVTGVPRRLAHADVMRECLDGFIRLLQEAPSAAAELPALAGASIQRILADVQASTGLALEPQDLPLIPCATYVRSSPCTIRGLKGARLDFRCQRDGAETCDAVLICVFILPLQKVKIPDALLRKLAEDGYCFRCVESPGPTVFCMRSEKYLYNVVTSLDEEQILSRYRPKLCGRGK